jgi:hypothetical protein
MEPSPSSEATSCSAAQEFPKILWNPKFHHSVYKSPLLVFIPSQINPVNGIPYYSSKVNFNIILPPTSRSGLFFNPVIYLTLYRVFTHEI